MRNAKQYRKKPVIIEAQQFTGGAEAATPIIDWILSGDGTATWQEELPERRVSNGELSQLFDAEHLNIRTLEGTMRAEVGDYIIRGTEGEFYPCKPVAFAATFEPLDQPIDATEYVNSNNSFHRYSLGDEVKSWWGNKRGPVKRIFKKGTKSRWYVVLDMNGTEVTVFAADCEKVRS